MTFNKSNVIVSGSRSSLSKYANYTTVYPKPAMVGGKIVLTQDMINKQNVKYIIKWNFDLDDETITVPEGCLIEFDGGIFSNGTLVGNETILVYNQEEKDVFKNVSLEGSFERSTSAIADKMDNTNGMAKIYLKKNKPLATQLTQPNTIYVIQYDFTLGNDITVPENCVLEFDGGSVGGQHTLTGANTGIQAGLVKIFNTNITLAGSWNVAEVYPEWFGGIDEYWNERIQKAIDFSTLSSGKVLLTKRTYLITGTRFYQNTPCLIVVRNNTSIISYNKSELKLAAKSYIYTEDYECVLGNTHVNPRQCYNVIIDGIRINQEEEIFIDPQISEQQRLHICVELYNCVNTTINNCSFYVKGQNAVCLYTNDSVNFGINYGNKITNCEFISLQKEYDYDQSAIFIKSFATVVSNNVIKDVSNTGTTFGMRGGIEFHGSFLTATGNTLYGIRTGFNITPHRGSLNGRNLVISNNNMTDGKTFVRIYPEDLNESVQEHVETLDALINANVCTNVNQMIDVFNSINRYKATINGLSITENIFKRSDSIGEYIFAFAALGKVKNVNIDNNIIYGAKCKVLYIADTNYIVEPSTAEIENIVFSNNLIYGCFDFENTTSADKPLFLVHITKTPVDYNKVIIKENLIDIKEDAACSPYLLKGRCAFYNNLFPHGLSLLMDEYITLGTFDIYSYVKNSKLAQVGSAKIRNNISSLCIGNGTDKIGTISGTVIKQSPYPMIELSNSELIDVGDTISVIIGENVNIQKTNVYSKVGNKITVGWINQNNINNGDAASISFVEAKWRALQGDASGTWADKPLSSEYSIPIGFRYFCTDKQTTEGATNGIEIIYKGNNVWVDALGRVVS